jgi:hypothetical protein
MFYSQMLQYVKILDEYTETCNKIGAWMSYNVIQISTIFLSCTWAPCYDTEQCDKEGFSHTW